MYQTIHELPAVVRKKLPEHACELYMAAHNRIREKAIANGEDDQAEIARAAHDGAMLAVQTEFEVGDDGQWRRAPIGKDMDHLGKADPDRPEGTGHG